MNKLRCILLFLFIINTTFSQSIFVPTGSHFNYQYMDDSGAYTGVKTLFYTSDTLINSITYKKICSASDYHCICPNPHIYNSSCKEYLLERNDSLYQFFPSNDSLQLLYTFNASVGDSVVFDSGNPNFRYKNVLDSTGIVFICNANRLVHYYTKYQNVCPTTSNVVTIVNGIGPIDDYLFPQSNGCELSIGRFTFNCVNNTYGTYPISNCTPEPLLVKGKFNCSAVIISNNPNGIEVSSPEPLTGTIEIYDLMGHLLSNTNLHNQSTYSFRTELLAKGIYLISLYLSDSTGSVSFTRKFIIE